MSVSRAHAVAPGERVSGRLKGLQVGRGMAALSVVVGHAVAMSSSGNAWGLWEFLGRYGVTLFFIISGFIMVHTTGRGPFDARRFMASRLRRIVPLYLLANLVLAVVTLVAPHAFRRTVFNAWHILLSILFIPAYDPAGSGRIWPFFRLGWTLNYEMFFYFCFAALAFVTVRTRVALLSFGFLALIVIGQLHSFQDAIPRFYTQIDTLGFVVGAVLGLAEMRGKLRLKLPTAIALAAFTLLASGFLSVRFDTIRDFNWTQIMVVVICAIHLVLLTMLFDVKRFRYPALILRVGDMSYSLYLFHMFPVGLFAMFEHKAPPILVVPLIGLSIVATLAISAMIYHFVERPFDLFLRRAGRRSHALGEGVDERPSTTFHPTVC